MHSSFDHLVDLAHKSERLDESLAVHLMLRPANGNAISQ